jgi:hypothetical protein
LIAPAKQRSKQIKKFSSSEEASDYESSHVGSSKNPESDCSVSDEETETKVDVSGPEQDASKKDGGVTISIEVSGLFFSYIEIIKQIKKLTFFGWISPICLMLPRFHNF